MGDGGALAPDQNPYTPIQKPRMRMVKNVFSFAVPNLGQPAERPALQERKEEILKTPEAVPR